MLQLVEVDNFYEGSMVVQLKTGGFEIDLLNDHPELGQFNVKTFYIFIKVRNTDMAYGPVNQFLSDLSIDKQQRIAIALIMMNGIMRTTTENTDDINQLLDQCGMILDTLDQEIGLCDDILNWVKTFVPISDMSSAGSGPHHSADMTFHQDEAITITAITILSKLFSPVVGEFIYRHAGLINNLYKESFACSMFTQLFKRKYADIIKKMQHYIGNLVANKMKSVDMTIHYRGFTPEMIARIIMDTTIIKKFVSIDLFKPDGNVIKYVAACITSYIESQQKNGGAKFKVDSFTDPKDGDAITGTEETNSSRIEIESSASHKPMLAPPMSRFAAKWIIRQSLIDENISAEEFERSISFFEKNPIVVSPVTLFILSTYFGPDAGGGHSIYLLDAPLTIKLAALLQIIAARSGADAIAHMLTMKITTEDRLGQATDFNFSNSWRASPEYSECRKTVGNGFGEITWDCHLRELATTLTSKTFIYHTPQHVWDLLGQENKNGTVFNEQLPFMLQLLKLISNLWKQRSLTNDKADSETSSNS